MLIRLFFTTLRGLAAAVALVLLVLLLGWTALQWLVLPHLDDYRPQLTAWMSRALDAQVSVQQLSVQASWWHPVVVVRGLEVADADGQPGLRAPQARLRLSPLALLHASAGALDVRAPEVWLRRDAAGKLFVAGVPRAMDAQGAGWAGHLLLLRPRVDVHNARLHWRDARQGGALTLDDVNLRMQSRWRRLGGHLTAARLTGQLGADLPPLHLNALAANVRWQRSRRGGREGSVRLDGVQLDLAGGGRLDGMDLAVTYPGTAAQAPLRVRVSGAALPALGQLAQHLPWPDRWQRALRDIRLDGGVLESLDLQWQGPPGTPRFWRASASVRGLALAPLSSTGDKDAPARAVGRPGVSGLDLTLEADDVGGRATLVMDGGHLSFPGVFEDPDLAVQRLRAEAHWQLGPDGVRVDVPRLELANADAEGQFSGSWRSGDGRPGGAARFPGFLDLTGRLTRGDGARVHRYLPLVLPADARHYVRDAVVQGRLSDVAVRVRGRLDQVPFNEPGEEGVFSVAGRVDDGVMAYVPPRLQDAGEPAWPELTELSGQLAFEGAAMRVRQASAQVRGHAGWQFADIAADIADFDAEHVAVTVSADGSGELGTALDIVRTSPLAALTEHVLDDARAHGDARLRLALDLPVDDPARTTVRGEVQLEQNTITLRPGVPRLDAAQGTVAFTETGFALDQVRARLLGHPAQLSGGLARGTQGADAPAHIRLQGRIAAAGLQELATQAGVVPGATALRGETAYDLTLDLAPDGVRAVTLDSDLQGLALALPSPLDKPADAHWPLHLRWQREGAAGDAPASRLALQLADRFALQWVLPPGGGASPTGTMAWGAAARRPLPPSDSGLYLLAELDALDVDRWLSWVRLLGLPAQGAADRWLPDRWRVTLGQLRVAGYELADVASSGRRQGTRWQGEVQAPDLAGHVEYQATGAEQPGHVEARLSRLSLRPAAQEGATPDPAPARDLPSVNLRADRFAWKGLDLGQLDLRASRTATPDAPTWRVDQLLLTTPEARLQAHGSRTLGPTAAARDGSGQTELAFQLALNDAGALLDRLGQPGVMAGGSGTVTGDLSWPGSPLDFSVVGLSGDLQLDVTDGRFLQMEPGAGKLFGILSLQALPRRLMLDFNDVFRSGWAFDSARAGARLARGVLSTDDLQIQGVGATVAIRGQTHLSEQTLDLNLRVEPRLDAGAAALAATAINPALGAAAFVAQLALRKPLGRAAARTFRVRGSWSDPDVRPMESAAGPGKSSPAKDDGEAEDRMPAAGENSP